MVILPLAAILVVLAVLGGSALLRAASTRRVGPLGGTAVAAAGALAVLGLAAVVTLGIGRGGDSAGHGAASGTTVPEVEPAPDEPSPRPSPGGRRLVPERLGPIVQVAPQPVDADAFPPPERAIDGLDDEVVLRVRARGFEPFTSGRARQCVRGPAAETCGNAIDVQFDSAGRASFQYLVADQLTDAPDAGRCRADDPPCYLVVEDGESAEVAETRTVFGDELRPPGRLDVSPRRRVADGTVVTVRAEGFRAGERLRVALCAAPATSGTGRCGAPGPATELVVGPDGAGATRLTLEAGPVGSEGVRCGDGTACGVAATTATGQAVGVVPVSFAASPGADVDPAALALGLGIAALLVLVAAVLVRRTDWSPLGEEAAPEIDGAEYADLDAIVAALPVEDGSGVVTST